MRVLIASLDSFTATSTRLILAKEKVICDTTDLGEDGLQVARLYEYDVILFDLMLPDMESYRTLGRLRAAGVRAPILILSRPGELDQRLKFLHSGADDFLIKPFDSRELIARIQLIVRRSNGHSESAIRIGKLVVNLDTRIVSIDDQPVHLTNKEYAILELLSLRKGTTVTRENLLDQLY
jgi:two-component system cell cycle response regulator CtrA